MSQQTAFRVSTAQACTGRGGYYEMRLHRVPRGGRPQSEKIPISGDCTEIDRSVDLSALNDPAELLAALRKLSPKLGVARFDPRELATASLVRMCARIHPGSRRMPDGRPEAVSRRVWVPSALGAPALRVTGLVRVDENGIGEMAIHGGSGRTVRRPMVSVPLTGVESSMVTKLAVPVTVGTDAEHSTYVLLHPTEGRQFVEQVVRPALLHTPDATS